MMSSWERDAARNEARARYRRGDTVPSIAQSVEVHERTVARWVSDIKDRLSPRATDGAILALGRTGISMKRISERLQVAHQRVSSLLKLHGVPVRRRGQVALSRTNAQVRRGAQNLRDVSAVSGSGTDTADDDRDTGAARDRHSG